MKKYIVILAALMGISFSLFSMDSSELQIEQDFHFEAAPWGYLQPFRPVWSLLVSKTIKHKDEKIKKEMPLTLTWRKQGCLDEKEAKQCFEKRYKGILDSFHRVRKKAYGVTEDGKYHFIDYLKEADEMHFVYERSSGEHCLLTRKYFNSTEEFKVVKELWFSFFFTVVNREGATKFKSVVTIKDIKKDNEVCIFDKDYQMKNLSFSAIISKWQRNTKRNTLKPSTEFPNLQEFVKPKRRKKTSGLKKQKVLKLSKPRSMRK